MWILRLLLAATLVRSAFSLAQALPVLPPPSYGNTVYLFVHAPNLLWGDAAFQPEADVILAALHGGPYARVGASSFLAIDLPWAANLANPVLSSPTPAWLSAALSRAQTRGLAVHFGTYAGLSRGVWIYDDARREDRRNGQWYQDGKILRVGAIPSPFAIPPDEIWMTPSRYARKLRRHLQTKVRAFARSLVELRQQYPDTLVSASGDAEMELNSAGLDGSVSFENQTIADYSPFAIAEFRDWIRNAGLYGPGQPYDGQGLAGGGARYGGLDGLQNFKADYGAGFDTWRLHYFDWDVTNDPVDGDPKAIPAAAYEGTAWTPLPLSGPDLIPGGFDAPRSAGLGPPFSPFWTLWIRFRETMVANYQKDFAAWVTTTADANGNTFDAQRWYSHQIPADYLGGNSPVSSNPNPRLRTSASPMWTANVAPSGSLGLTAFDVYWYDPITNSLTYDLARTSANLFDALKARGVSNWGLVEWSPSWPLGPFDPDVLGIAANAKHAYDAGAHILNYLDWDHFVGNPPLNPTHNPQALDQFLSQVKNQPRVTQVSGLSGRWFSATISLSWSDLVYPGVAGFHYADWTAFARFEVWRGASATFDTLDGVKVGNTTTASRAGIEPDASKPFYRVRAVARDGSGWPLSDAVSPPPPGGSGFFPITPCRQLDTRGTETQPGSPIAALGTQTVTLTGGPCFIPATAKSVSANLTVTQPTARGSLAIVASDAAGPTTTSNVTFGAAQTRASSTVLLLAGDGSGTVRLENGSAGTLHAILDVNGYFQ